MDIWPSRPGFLDNQRGEVRLPFCHSQPPDVGLLLGCCSVQRTYLTFSWLTLVRSARPYFGSEEFCPLSGVLVMDWDGHGGSSEPDPSYTPLSLPCAFTHLAPGEEAVGLSVESLGR